MKSEAFFNSQVIYSSMIASTTMEELMIEQVRQLIQRMELERRAQEEVEDYESCAALRDDCETLGKFVLGYETWDDVADTLLFWVQYYGVIVLAETMIDGYYVTYYTSDPVANWTFWVDTEDYYKAVDILAEDKRKKKLRNR